ncbi:hypothetical protein [Stieleria varia]|uniref:Uncharacterized protein n=1 Tax=Stieleria varia TaxID=2528005 RepID=A0A5C6B0Z5_9BACT|nr:hypothetical protein [Stieleria varia]TWU04966.1 hypothetical protein Pla52n_30110 [Stieleria varia]
MHCVTLTDLAAALSQHGPQLIYRRQPLPDKTLVQYWTASRTRFESWHRRLAQFRLAQQADDWDRMSAWWSEHLATMEEILVSEILTRVVAAVAVGLDEAFCHDALIDDSTSAMDAGPSNANNSVRPDRSIVERIAPITHGVFLSHLEASNRVHQMMLARQGSSVEHLVRLNRLRQGIARWNDLLIGRLSVESSLRFAYSIDTQRAKDFGEEIRDGDMEHRTTTAWLMNAAMRDMMIQRTSDTAASPRENRAVASSVLQMFRPALFDSLGHPKSTWMHQLHLNGRHDDGFVRSIMI